MGGPCAQICIEKGLGGTVVAPVAVEAWMPVVVGMTGVILFHTTAPMPHMLCTIVHVPFTKVDVVVGAHAAHTLLFTMHGRIRPIGGNVCRGEGPCGSPPC
jgi:hypothetical protein